MADVSTTPRVPPRPESSRLPQTRPRGRLTFVLPLVLAAALGAAAGVSPRPTLQVLAAVVATVVLAPRLEWAALAVIVTAVFEDYLDAGSPWATEFLAVLLVVAWAIRRSRGPLHEHRNLSVLVPAAVLAAAVALSLAAHANGRAGVEVSLHYAEFVLVLVVLTDCLSGPLRPHRAARFYVWSCVLAALCGIVTALVDERHRVLGPLADPDDLAFFLVAAVPLLGTVLVRRGQRLWPVWTAFAVVMVGIVGTQSRGAFVAVGAMLVLAVVSGVLAARHAGALLVLLATAAAFVLAVLPHPVGDALSEQQRYAETKISERVELWQSAAAMTREQPVVGLGPGAFALFHQDYRDDAADPSALDPDVAHSTVLEASSELGVLGATALFAVFLVPAAAACRRWRRDRSQLAAAVCLALAGLLTASLFETEQYRLPLWFLAAMAAGVGHRAPARFPFLGDDSSGQVAARS